MTDPKAASASLRPTRGVPRLLSSALASERPTAPAQQGDAQEVSAIEPTISIAVSGPGAPAGAAATVGVAAAGAAAQAAELLEAAAAAGAPRVVLSITTEGFRAVAARVGAAAAGAAAAVGAATAAGPEHGGDAGAGAGAGGPAGGGHTVLASHAGRPAGGGARAPRARTALLAEGSGERGRELLDGLQRLAGIRPGRPARPVGGYFCIEMGGRRVDVELTVVPAVGGEHAAFEVCTRCAAPRSLADLGLEPGDLARLRALASAPFGLLAITGDTGSGRSTAYGALIDALAGEGRRVVALQRSVAVPDRRVTYLRLPEGDVHPPEAWIEAAERLAPDVLALDDIASAEATARAVRTALGSALVVQVRPEDDAVAAARALEALPLERGAVGAALLGILAVRLVRRICAGCARSTPPPIELAAAARALGGPADGAYAEGEGCEACGFTGTHGVTAVFELTAPDDRVRARLIEARGAHDLSAFAAEGRPASIRAQVVKLAASGAIPIRELARVL